VLREAERSMCYDYYQAWVAATAAREPALFSAEDVYTVGGRVRLDRAFDQRAAEWAGPDPERQRKSRRLHAAYVTKEIRSSGTPWHYTALGWIIGRDYDRDQLAWQVLSLVALLGAVGILGVLGAGLGAPVVLLAAAYFAWAFLPARADLWVGNVARMQVGGVALVAALAWSRWPGRHVAAGVVLGALVTFKPNLAPLCVVLVGGWLARKELARVAQVLAGLVLGVLASMAAASWRFGTWRAGQAWYAQLAEVAGTAGVAMGNVGGSSPFQRLAPGVTGMLLEAACFALLAAAVVRTRSEGGGNADRRADLFLIGIGCAASAPSSPLVWPHYFVLLVPLCLFVLRPPPRPASALAWGAWGLALAWVLVAGQWPPGLFPATTDPASAWLLVAAAYGLLLIGLARHAYAAGRPQRPKL
jgi:hypothetical protein